MKVHTAHCVGGKSVTGPRCQQRVPKIVCVFKRARPLSLKSDFRTRFHHALDENTFLAISKPPSAVNAFAAIDAALVSLVNEATLNSSLLSFFPPSTATAASAQATTTETTGSPVVTDTNAAAVVANKVDANASVSFAPGAHRATATHEFKLTKDAHVIQPKCMATGR